MVAVLLHIGSVNFVEVKNIFGRNNILSVLYCSSIAYRASSVLSSDIIFFSVTFSPSPPFLLPCKKKH